MNRTLSLTLAAVAVAACSDARQPTAPLASAAGSVRADVASGAVGASDAGVHVYDVTITNLTTSQPFSPGVAATHTKHQTVWRVGAFASEGIRFIAENGDQSVAVTSLTGQPGMFDVVGVNAPTGRIGGSLPVSQTIRISARANANRLSLAVMLICTNDGFTGLDGVKLPGGFKPETFYTAGYDAGTEANDELYTHIVDPCSVIGPVSVAPDGQNLRTPTHDRIHLHPGILGVADLSPAAHGWVNPVARITIQRVK